ncbi:MAG: lipoyl synthase [Candidatus Bathyarchaeia archaeon]
MTSAPKPTWLRVRPPSGERYLHVKATLNRRVLHTVCEEAHCPNLAECWGGGTATIMLMGDTCTRACRFCMVKAGNPKGWLDHEEPRRVAESVAALGLDYVVLTSVNRDDLPDGGSEHFARTIREMKTHCPGILVEALIPDFQGDTDALQRIIATGAEVVGHNIETTRRLTPRVRDPRASYSQSLDVLKRLKQLNPEGFTKSSIMLGLGEHGDEPLEAMKDLRSVGVDILTLGQYLRPSPRHLPVVEYVTPERFEQYKRVGEQLGFLYVAAGPLVRSSYRAGEYFLKNILATAT